MNEKTAPHGNMGAVFCVQHGEAVWLSGYRAAEED